MKTQIATPPDQSKRLLACGVNHESADMSYVSYNGLKDDALSTIPYKRQYMPNKQPAWSLSALLELLPKEIMDDNEDSYYLALAQEFPLSYEYAVSYQPCWSDGDAIMRERDNCPIEACVKAIEWLTANGYTLNTK